MNLRKCLLKNRLKTAVSPLKLFYQALHFTTGFFININWKKGGIWQPPALVTTTLYMVESCGVATGFDIASLDNPVEGVHLKFPISRSVC